MNRPQTADNQRAASPPRFLARRKVGSFAGLMGGLPDHHAAFLRWGSPGRGTGSRRSAGRPRERTSLPTLGCPAAPTSQPGARHQEAREASGSDTVPARPGGTKTAVAHWLPGPGTAGDGGCRRGVQPRSPGWDGGGGNQEIRPRWEVWRVRSAQAEQAPNSAQGRDASVVSSGLLHIHPCRLQSSGHKSHLRFISKFTTRTPGMTPSG